MENNDKKRNFLQSFVLGANKGLKLSFTSMAPNVIFAFAIIHLLNESGATALIEKVFGPLMGIFGLPGAAAACLMAAFLSTGGGIGAVASMAAAGQLNGSHVTILLVGVMMLGSFLQYMGRVLGTAEVPSKHYGILMLANILSTFLAMFVTQFFV